MNRPTINFHSSYRFFASTLTFILYALRSARKASKLKLQSFLNILFIMLFGSTYLLGQEVSESDSLEISTTYQMLFKAIESDDLETLYSISTDSIYCMMCFEYPNDSKRDYKLDQMDFFENYLPTIKSGESFQRISKNSDLILFEQKSEGTDIIVFWTIYEPDELAPGHEGGQFGIHFKEESGKFKFSGMERVP